MSHLNTEPLFTSQVMKMLCYAAGHYRKLNYQRCWNVGERKYACKENASDSILRFVLFDGIADFASDLCPGETCYPFPRAVQVTIWPQNYNSKHSPVFQPKTNLLSFPTWQLNKYFVLTIWKGEPRQKGFVHCSYKHQPCLQIRPEQAAQSEHIYSTNVTPFCSESTTSSLQLLIYLLFVIVHQAILASDCSSDLPDIFLTSVSYFYFVGTATFLLESRELEGQGIPASLSEWPSCNDCSQSLLDPTLSLTISASKLICLKHSEIMRQPMQLRQIQFFIWENIQGN